VNVSIRKFERADIPLKVGWINNPENNRFLHYDLPLCIEKTEKWFDAVSARTDRFDAVIEADGIPVGTIGLLSIDRKNGKSEFYVAMGDVAFKGKGIAAAASRLLLRHAFKVLGLNRIYLFTEVGNLPAQRLFERLGFEREGELKQDVVSGGRFVNRFVYSFLKEKWPGC
jgi:RimJ/RimL family protein N-acetyltransferase